MKKDQSFELEQIVSGLEALIGRGHVAEEYVRFRVQLVAAQTVVRDTLTRSATAATTAAEPGAAGLPLGPDSVPWDRALLERLLEKISAALDDGGPGSADLIGLSAAARHQPELLAELARRAGFGPDGEFLSSLSERLKLSFDGLVFFGRVLAAPFVAAAVGQLKRQHPSAATSSGRCPWCGSLPGLARLTRDEHHRVLCCSLCGESWEFARLQCPFCENQGAVGVLYLEAADPCTVETCQQCKGYLKTVDEQRLPEDEAVVPLVQATATLHLDLIAQQKGYRQGPPYAALQ